MAHLLSLIDYKDVTKKKLKVPPKQKKRGYKRLSFAQQKFVPQVY